MTPAERSARRKAYKAALPVLIELFKPYGYELTTEGDHYGEQMEPQFWHPEDEDGTVGSMCPTGVIERIVDEAFAAGKADR